MNEYTLRNPATGDYCTLRLRDGAWVLTHEAVVYIDNQPCTASETHNRLNLMQVLSLGSAILNLGLEVETTSKEGYTMYTLYYRPRGIYTHISRSGFEGWHIAVDDIWGTLHIRDRRGYVSLEAGVFTVLDWIIR